MSIPFIPELAELLHRVEQKFAHRLSTTSDYELLAFVIDREIDERVSASTLKRLWGYVSYTSVPRMATMDTLCRYIGFKNFDAFCEDLRASGAVVSAFFTTKVIASSSLEEGAQLMIGWAPNRLVKLKYLGASKFTVLSVQNSKLCEGDSFEASEFVLGAPLFMASVTRADGSVTSAFVAAKADGLNLLERL